MDKLLKRKHCLKVLLSTIFLVHVIHGTTYNRTNEGLTDIPTDIPSAVTQLNLSQNILSEIGNRFVGLNSVTHFTAPSNNFVIFPNLFDIRTTIKHIDLEKNSMTYIAPERLNILTSLEHLKLGKNKLTQFPNVKGPSNTLYFLSLERNKFEIFPDMSIVGKNLEEIDLKHNNIHSFPPGVYALGPPAQPKLKILRFKSNNIKSPPLTIGPYLGNCSQEVYMQYNPIECDWSVVWLVLLPSVTLGFTSCSAPASLYGKQVNKITVDDLKSAPELARPPIVMSLSRNLHQDTYSLVMPLEKVTLTKAGCYNKCLSIPGCLYINYNNNGDQCHFASPEMGQFITQKPDTEQGWMYYEVGH